MSGQPAGVSPFTKALTAAAGLALALAGLGVIPVEPTALHSPRAVLFAIGMILFVLGTLGLLHPHRARYPRLFDLGVALGVTACALLAGLMAAASHDEALAIGPFVFRGPAVDAFGKVVLWGDTALVAGAAAWAWRAWWRRPPPSAG